MTLLVVPWVTQGQTTLTVNDGTQTNDYVPIYGYMADNVTRSQFVIPASDLTDVVNNLISKLTFYSGTASKDWGGSWKVYLKEISSTTLTAYQDWSSLTEVYSGSLSIAGNQMVVEFQDGFLYLGGNLLVGVYQVSSGNWLSSVHWQGVTASSGASLYSYGSSSGSAQSFLPKMTIEYAMPPSCIKPGNITTSNVTASSADVTWVAGGTETSWQYLYGTTGFTPDWSDATLVATASASLTGLSANTEYDLYVRSYCSESDQSDPVKKSFRTDCDVIADVDLPYFEDFDSYSSGSSSAIDPCWTKGTNNSTAYPYPYSYYHYGTAGNSLYFYSYFYSDYYSYAALPKFASDINKLQLNFKMYVSTASYPIEVGVMTDPSDYSTFTRFGEAILAGSTSTWVDKEVFFDTYTGPDGYIAFRCPETGSYSVYIDNVSVSKIPSCKPVQSVSVNNIERVAFDVTWTPKSGVTNCEGYEVVVSDTELDATALESATKHMVTDGSNTYHATGLTRNTTYYVYVRSNCGATDGVSEWLSTSVTTAALSGVDEVQIGNETLTTSYQFPFSAYYHNSYTQQVYAKNELNHESGAISSLSFNYFWATSTTRYVTIYMANVPEGSNVSSNWISSGLTEVYSGKATTFSSTDGWCTIQLDDAFEYTGGDVLVAMYMQYNSCETQYSSNNRFYYSNGGFGRYATNDNSSASGLSLNSDNVPSTSGSSVTYRPNIRFGFPFGIDPCPAVETVSYELTGEGTTTATVSWTASAGDYANTYDVYYSTTEVTDFSGVTPQFTGVTALSQALTGLSPYTDYYVYVMCHCDGEGQNDGISTWNGVQFKTNSACRVVTDLDVVPASKYTATATWTGTTQANNFQYVLSTTEMTDAELETASPAATGLTEATATLTGLVPEQTYYLYVANNCTGEGLSPYIGTSFTMPVACAEPANLAIANLGKYSFTPTWDADIYADATDTYDLIVSDAA